MQALELTISSEDIARIRRSVMSQYDGIRESVTSYSELNFENHILEVEVNAIVDVKYEEETNASTETVSHCVFTIKLYNEDGEMDFSDDFERDIFEQLKEIEGEEIL